MRLIDADKVVEYCCGYFGHCTQECTKCGFANSVRNIPTAYDVEKVVAKLIEHAERVDEFGGYENGKLTIYTRTMIPVTAIDACLLVDWRDTDE